MARAVEPINIGSTPSSAFPRSHSSPELVSIAPSPKSPPASLSKSASSTSLSHNGSTTHSGSLGPKGFSAYDFPSFEVPAFELPTFDPSPDFHTNLFLDGGSKITDNDEHRKSVDLVAVEQAAALRRGSLTKERRTTAKTAQDMPAHEKGVGTNPRTRKNSSVDRPLSWRRKKDSMDFSEPSTAPDEPWIEDISDVGPEVRVEDVGKIDDEPEPVERTGRAIISGSLSSLRKTWMSSSRSPSPQRNKDGKRGRGPNQNGSGTTVASPKPARTLRKRSALDPTTTTTMDASSPAEPRDTLRGTTKALNRATFYLARIKKNSAKNATADSDTSCASSATSLAPPVVSTVCSDRRRSHTTSIAESVTTAATTATDEAYSEIQARERDAMWFVFHELDVEHGQFTPKSTPARAGVIKSSLLPFLCTYETHHSNKGLRPDDLERRASILNKWWASILEMLEGRDQQPLPATDRPVLLEAATKIMMRPEWRQATRSYMPLEDRELEDGQARRRSGTTSTESLEASESSATSATSADAAQHNVGVIFTRNLIRQMHLVTQKMSQKHAPLSLVYFCGKACAYAFFFVPGAADVMVRLWSLRPEIIKATARKFGLETKLDDLPDSSEGDALHTEFPEFLPRLSWFAIRGGAKLRKPAQIPLQVSQIQWNGPWVARWRGRDTDLLFIFFKYFHILFAEFVPAGLPLSTQARAPAFALVHAQLLEIIDSTIHRQASLAMEQRSVPGPGPNRMGMNDSAPGPGSLLGGFAGPPLSDAQHGADASMNTLQFPSSNLRRGMSENRLIVMFRDVLSSRMDSMTGARHTFAQASMAMLEAATLRTSRFNQHACFTLCDFLEEVLMAYNDGFDGTGSVETPATGAGDWTVAATADASAALVAAPPENPGLKYVDWRFWLDTLANMLEGLNTMTEVRVLSFLFTIWDILVADPVRKEEVSLGWLLQEKTFDTFFNHWCPMVRAYFMRLLAWRICREVGSPNEVDTKIFMTVAMRLRTSWQHYLFLRQNAEINQRVPPSTTPAEPQPGKKFAIIRTQVNAPQNVGLRFDSFSSQSPSSASLSSAPANPSSIGNPGGSGIPFQSINLNALGPATTADNTTFATMAVPLDGSAQAIPQVDSKKKPSFLSRVLSLASGAGAGNANLGVASVAGKKSTDEDDEGAKSVRAKIIGQRHNGNGKPSPPSSSDGESLVSSPVQEMSFVFRFVLTWYPPSEGPPMARILVHPALPRPAQARITVRSRAPSPQPPPPPPAIPAPTRTFSGSSNLGLVNEARNALPLSSSTPSPPLPRSPSPAFVLPPINTNSEIEFTTESANERDRPDVLGPGTTSSNPDQPPRGRQIRPSPAFRLGPIGTPPRPTRPEGFYRDRAVYIGRALAEWSLVIHECNTFVDRRRFEGMSTLADVEVPTLAVNEIRRPS